MCERLCICVWYFSFNVWYSSICRLKNRVEQRTTENLLYQSDVKKLRNDVVILECALKESDEMKKDYYSLKNSLRDSQQKAKESAITFEVTKSQLESTVKDVSVLIYIQNG